MSPLRAPLAGLALLAGVAGCIERAPGAGSSREATDRAVAARYVVTEAHPAWRVGAVMGGLELVGADVDPPRLRPGLAATLTLYWRVLEEPTTRWTVFLHLDAPGTARVHGDHAPAGGRYPTTAWRRGELIRDPVTVRLAPAYPARSVEVWAGLYAGSERAPVDQAGPLGDDGDDRVLVARLPVDAR